MYLIKSYYSTKLFKHNIEFCGSIDDWLTIVKPYNFFIVIQLTIIMKSTTMIFYLFL